MYDLTKTIRGLILFSLVLINFNIFAEEEVEEVVVTGSLIKVSAQNQAVPVDVISRDELEAQGSPNMIDVIINLPSM